MHVFLSDVHLASGRRDDDERLARVIRFLRQVAVKADTLWIGGDLFDFWFEWKSAIPKRHFAVLAELRALSEAGVGLHFLPGNHDFAMKPEFFRQELGAEVHVNPCEIQLDGVKIHWVHGDGCAASDVGYRIFIKGILHAKIAQRMFRWIHPDFAMSIAMWTSKSSRYKAETVGVPPDEEYQEYARKVFEATGANAVVMGHTHIPRCLQVGSGMYINSGDFVVERSYAVLDQGAWRIERFEHDESSGHNRIRTS